MISVVASVVGAYYLRIVKLIYFDEPTGAYLPMAPALKVVLGLSSVVVLFFWMPGIPYRFLGAASAAAKSLF